MHFVTPSAHLVAYTHIDPDAEAEMLAALGAPEEWETDATNDADRLTEVMGRLCYKSFGTDMNANLTRVREGNEGYIGNILKTQHGSVLEHATATVGFIDVSPVVTHELVRHRAGTAFSQVSMRFVRLQEIGFYYPDAFGVDFLEELYGELAKDFQLREGDTVTPVTPREFAEWGANALKQKTEGLLKAMEEFQYAAADIAKLDSLKSPGSFDLKKRFTSSMRRLAPYGLSTAIGVTMNHRAWRFAIQQRTSRHAEEEIRLAFGLVAPKLAAKMPSLYQDMSAEMVNGHMEYTFANHKV